MAEEEKKKEGKSKGGRPKGSKSLLGIPMKGIKEAIDLTKTLWDNTQGKLMSFEEFCNFLNLKAKGISTPVAGALSEYGFIEKIGSGWKVSELGKKAIEGDATAIKQALEKNSIFKELFNNFENKEVTSGLIVDYLKKRYKKGGNVYIIESRFTEATNYIKSLGRVEITGSSFIATPSVTKNLPIAKLLKLIQLKYALNPPDKSEVKRLVEELADDLKEEQDVSISTLVKSMDEHKENNEVLKALADSLINIVSKKYPEFLTLKEKKKEQKHSTKEENKE